jgi:hypothetical protein
MRRLALVLAIFALTAPAAHASGLEVLQDLAKRHLSPAPLVPTKGPGLLADLDRTLQSEPALRKGGYALRLAHYTPAGPDAIIALSRGDYKNMSAALRAFRGYRRRPTRVRGHKGLLLTRHLSVTERNLLWKEGGQIYLMGSGTPKTVSVAALRTAAASLDPLGRNYIGSLYTPDNESFDAVLVTTQHTVSGDIEWGASCTYNGFPSAGYAGQADFTMRPLNGNAFSIPLTDPSVTPQGWSGSIGATVAPSSATLNIQASGSFGGSACSIGPMALTADQKDPI